MTAKATLKTPKITKCVYKEKISKRSRLYFLQLNKKHLFFSIHHFEMVRNIRKLVKTKVYSLL